MEYVKYTDSPKVDDTVGFVLETYGDDGLLRNPYLIEKATVFYIEKNAHRNDRALTMHELSPDLEEVFEGNLEARKRLGKPKVYSYTNAVQVMETRPIPIWREGQQNNGLSNIEPGKFMLFWMPKDMREGSYLIRWYWKNTKDGKTRSTEKLFTLHPSEQALNSIYRKFVPREKYNFLFDLYIPPMYRVKTSPNDITPEVLVKLNKSVAQCLLELDDLAVGLIDILNPTYIPEGFLPVMANLFNLELRSNNPAAWRNQIKHALPLYKKKGTLEGLTEALDKAGIRLLKLTNLWQVISPYTWTDGFVVDKDVFSNDLIGYLSRKPMADAELQVSLKSAETDEYFDLPSHMVTLQEVMIPEAKMGVIWNGAVQEPPIELFKGDVLKIRYNYNKIPDDARTMESYIESLPLADQRDETKVKYPIKNWNVKLIEEDDPFFTLLIPERHPFFSPVTFGKIRTTFLYSEKAFNMDTFNGSLYNSNNPCDMDKDFVDPCSGGQSSKFNVHLEFDQVNNEKVKEAKEIITDYSPFHAILHNMKVSSRATEFITSPTERIKSEVKHKEKQQGDKVSATDTVYCQIRYKDGRVENGRIV